MVDITPKPEGETRILFVPDPRRRYEGLAMLWVQPARAALLLAAIGWCLWLSWRVCAALSAPRRTALWLIMTLACSLIGYGWWLQFWSR